MNKNSKENLISDTPGYYISKAEDSPCNCYAKLTFLPAVNVNVSNNGQGVQDLLIEVVDAASGPV